MPLTQAQCDQAAALKAANPSVGRVTLARALGCSERQAQQWLAGRPVVGDPVPRRVNLSAPQAAHLAAAAPKRRDEFAGVDGFAALHAPAARQRRRDEATKAAVEAFIAGPLKQRGWYYDQDAARVAGVGSQDWARFRDAYSHLHVMVRTDGASRGEKICWCHPDCVEEMRAVAEGRSYR